MNQIRSTLDSHDPKEVTHKIRQEALRQRDERILELWKKDQEQPKVGQLIEALKKERLKQPRNDFGLDVSIEIDELRPTKNEFVGESSIYSTTHTG